MNPGSSHRSKDKPFPSEGSSRAWRIARRVVIGIIAVITLVTGFYTIENYRGRRAWESARRELDSRGIEMNWAAYIPAPVPPEENIFAAPHMQEWFVGRGGNDLTRRIGAVMSSRTIVADIVVLTSSDAQSRLTNVDLTLEYNPQTREATPQDRERLAELIRHAIEGRTPTAPGLSASFQPNSRFVPGKSTRPLVAIIRADVALTSDQIRTGVLVSASEHGLNVEPMENGRFRVVQGNAASLDAEAFIAQTDVCRPELNLIRQALERPNARMDGDYSRPYAMPIPNFIAVRSLAQLLADRARCHLVLGEPGEALRELELLAELPRILEGDPVTLVAAMMKVAVSGLYSQTVADGFRIDAWREPQWIALEAQLNGMNLFPEVVRALQVEPVAVCHTLETTPTPDLARMFGKFIGPDEHSGSRFFHFIPRGWIYQNTAAIAAQQLNILNHLSPTNRFVEPRVLDAADLRTPRGSKAPYTFIAAMTTHNISRLWQTTARNQTLVNQARLAGALERFRLARGDYPESLDALAPQFIPSVPPDVVGGQPLKYRRSSDGRFVLYSVGWNETDDGGLVRTNSAGKIELTEGDWVWPPES